MTQQKYTPLGDAPIDNSLPHGDWVKAAQDFVAARDAELHKKEVEK
jgi:hypothetical protein